MKYRRTFRPYGASKHFGIINPPPAYAGGYRHAAPYGALVFGFAKNGAVVITHHATPGHTRLPTDALPLYI